MSIPRQIGQEEPSAAEARQRRFQLLDAWAYPVFAGELALIAFLLFFSSIKLQLFYSSVRGDPALTFGWSAPLDDVFIHFDFARSAARGHPFEWSEGNGYSSGGTSLTYPFVLGLGILAGFRDSALMEFAGIVACVSVLSYLLSARRLFRGLPVWAKYFAPPLLLSVGALNWTLWSGMEVSFFLAIWGAALVAWDDVLHGPPSDGALESTRGRAAVLGFCCLLLVATRPEAAVIVAIFSLSAAAAVAKSRGLRPAVETLLCAALPGALLLIAHAVANRLYTGDFSAAGALVKLEINDPKLTAWQAWQAWATHVAYQVTRVSGHHLAGNPYLGALMWGIAAVPLFSSRTRRYAGLLWACALAWIVTVAMNGQVRWQNERYTMPALAWMLTAAALGLGVLCSLPEKSPGLGARRLQGRVAAAVFIVGFFILQEPRFRDQLWFFGRASRNIFEQHVKTGRTLKMLKPRPRLVAVGDAGVIPFESDIPALDIIGLGGYSGLPFAAATRWGIASAIELIERMPVSERPDVLALYPTWWGDFPLWFGRRFGEVSVRGNVICGGLTKVLYEADFRALDRSHAPSSDVGTVVDSIDYADILSEADHSFSISKAVGFVTMKILPHPAAPDEPLWDAGRILPNGATTSFVLKGFDAKRPATVLMRLAPAQRTEVGVRVKGRGRTLLHIEPADRWLEVPVEIPAAHVEPELSVELTVHRNEVIVYHVWGIQAP